MAITPRSRSVMGTGFIALDLVITDGDKQSGRTWTGGTCGNVLAILGYLGWLAYPVARLRRDHAFEGIRRDLTRWGVQLDYIDTQPDTPTPIVVHHIRHDVLGMPSHSYSRRCPACGHRLPDYRTIPIHVAESIATKSVSPAVFFMDRVSPGILLLATAYARQGAVVVFEPNGVGDLKLFREALSLAHIVKYAHDRLAETDILGMMPRPLLEIETLGRDGLRYRSTLPACSNDEWKHMEAFRSTYVRDTAGAGDWCTAGIIDMITGEGINGLRQVTHQQVLEALRLGQAMAAWNCRFEGARGGMYVEDRDTFREDIRRILARTDTRKPTLEEKGYNRRIALTTLCAVCTSGAIQ